ncbi:hypothetical protein, partial [Streptosporangium canum]|uniref:hypothetical protein n=1 Tax=Streptosporangium canum TaxID=324952 RepID=UPI0033B2D6D5
PEGEPPSNSVATVRKAARLGWLESPGFIRGEHFKTSWWMYGESFSLDVIAARSSGSMLVDGFP